MPETTSSHLHEAIFPVRVPAAPPEPAAVPAIAIVRSDIDHLTIISHRLAGLGYRTFTAVSVAGAMTLLRRFRTHLLLVDGTLPGLMPAELLREARRQDPAIEVLITDCPLWLKGQETCRLQGNGTHCLKGGNGGHASVEGLIGEIFRRRQLVSAETPFSELSRRQQDLVLLLSQGLRNREIAEKLYISEKTVRNDLSGLYRRLGVSSRAQLLVLAHRLGLM
jgi:DNA-binding NarL/FixJ family response regulator